MTTADEKMRNAFSTYSNFQWPRVVDEASFNAGYKDAAAQYSDRIKELEQKNEQLQAQVSMLHNDFESTTNLCIKWYVSEREARFVFANESDRDKFARLITGVDVLGGTQTAEAYKRRIQAEAVKKFIENFSFEDVMNQYRCQHCKDDVDGVGLPLADALCAVGMSFNNAQCEVELLADYVGGAMLDENRRMASELKGKSETPTQN